MPEPQPGAAGRPTGAPRARSRTGIRRSPTSRPPHPYRSDQPEPRGPGPDLGPAGPRDEAQTSAQPQRRTSPNRRTRPTAADGPGRSPGAHRRGAATVEAPATAVPADREAPAPRWSGSAPVPPPLPRRRAWGESAEPTPPPPVPRRTAGAPDPGRPVGRRGHRRLGPAAPPTCPALPPTLPYPAPPTTRQWSGPPLPRSVRTRVSPPAAPDATARRAAQPADAGRADPRRRRAGPCHRRAAGHRCRSSAGAGAPTCHHRRPAGLAGPQGVRAGPGPPATPLAVAAAAHPGLLLRLPRLLRVRRSRPSTRPARRCPTRSPTCSLRQDDRSAETARQLESEVRKEHWLAEDTFAGVYSTTSGKRVTVFGGTGFRLSPESDADAEISRLTERYALGAPQTVDTGVRGRHERCAVGRADGSDVVVCTSVDHGSIATGVFTRLSVDDSAACWTPCAPRSSSPSGAEPRTTAAGRDTAVTPAAGRADRSGVAGRVRVGARRGVARHVLLAGELLDLGSSPRRSSAAARCGRPAGR